MYIATLKNIKILLIRKKGQEQPKVPTRVIKVLIDIRGENLTKDQQAQEARFLSEHHSDAWSLSKKSASSWVQALYLCICKCSLVIDPRRISEKSTESRHRTPCFLPHIIWGTSGNTFL